MARIILSRLVEFWKIFEPLMCILVTIIAMATVLFL